MTSRVGPRPPIILGQLAMIAGLLLMLILGESTPTALILVLLVPLGSAAGSRCRR